MTQKNNATVFIIEGIVTSGRGLAAKNMEVDCNGAPIYPGTLNIVLKEPLIFKQRIFKNGIISHHQYHPIVLNNIKCWVRRYPQCPFHILEVVAEEKLRDCLDLKDGGTVRLEIPETSIHTLGWMQYLLWILAWKGRETWFYKVHGYAFFISKFLNLRFRVLTSSGLNKDRYV